MVAVRKKNASSNSSHKDVRTKRVLFSKYLSINGRQSFGTGLSQLYTIIQSTPLRVKSRNTEEEERSRPRRPTANREYILKRFLAKSPLHSLYFRHLYSTDRDCKPWKLKTPFLHLHQLLLQALFNTYNDFLCN